jgi:ribose-phosphate pyrophosphokinase
VLPYLAYARQDKPTRFMREPITAKLMADLSATAGIDRIIAWHPHSEQLHGFYAPRPMNFLDPLAFFVEEFKHLHHRNDVIAVAPDAGASRLVVSFAHAINISSAIASKNRPQPEQVTTRSLIGNFSGKKKAIILDDMISSGGTLYALVEKLVEEKGIEEIVIAVSHNLCSNRAWDRLNKMHEGFNVKQFITTDSIPQTPAFRELPYTKTLTLADHLSRTINRIHYHRSVSQVFYDAYKEF